jgi:mercuric ion transport protein
MAAEDRHSRVARLGMASSVATALAASICCIGPIIAVMFGMTSLAALAKYEPLRPLFGAATAVLLAVAFYATYRRRADACEPGSVCATQGVDRVQKANRLALWLATFVAVIVFTFPTWSAWILG